jgi:acetolactate synthase-1/2/3 large subunit
VPTGTAAESFLHGLATRGVRWLFANGGTDFAPLVEAYAGRDGRVPYPDVVVCAHENLAFGMAHGAYLATGEPQVVALHTNVGTANAVCGVLNAHHARVPVLLVAGRTPVTEGGDLGSRSSVIHWSQEMFDQAGMVREAVKWDYELRTGDQLPGLLDRAFDVARTEPGGPVYLTLPREVLAAPVAHRAPAAAPSNPPAPAAPDPRALAELADRVAVARLPVIVTPASGADVRTVPVLEELCDRFAIGVVEAWPRHLNVRADHPLHLGYDVLPILTEADVLCFLDADVPWVPTQGAPSPDTFVAQCGPDPHFVRVPVRGHRSDLSITASNLPFLEALRAALEVRADRIPEGRHRLVAALGSSRRAAAEPAERAPDAPIDKVALNFALREVRPPDAVVFNEYWVRPDVLGSTRPGSYFGHPPAGGLGWGLPAALGWQLARPGDVVIAAVGDGAYLFANPAACHHAMAMHDLPVLTIVCANGRWGGVDKAAADLYPDGRAVGAGGASPFGRLAGLPAFEQYARASDGFGVRVTGSEELVPALREALAVVTEERRHALVHVDCKG